MKRPDCYNFAMDFLGEPEKGEIHKYIELLENRIAELESVKQTHALDAAKVCRVINHFYVDGVCSQCGSIEPPRQ